MVVLRVAVLVSVVMVIGCCPGSSNLKSVVSGTSLFSVYVAVSVIVSPAVAFVIGVIVICASGLVMFIAAIMYSIAYREKIEKKEIVKNLGGMLAVFVIWFLVSIDFSKDAQANSRDLMINIPIWISQALCCISHCNLFLNLLSLANKKD